MLAYFAATLFLSALLLFLVQPMVAKLTLPLLGGTPAVWNTCMVFYQAVLLLGYLYAHVTSRWLGLRWQPWVHLAILLLPIFVLPISIVEWGAPPGADNPIPWLLLVLSATVGLPFFAVSTTAPLLQRWFANTSHPAASDPYFLYGASNLGSMIALLGYPLVMEPTFRLAEQSWVWSVGYGIFVAMIGGCVVLLWRSTRHAHAMDDAATRDAFPANPFEIRITPLTSPHSRITLSRRLRWIALSFVPSSLLLGFTTYLTTDIAAVPLLWVAPLALYLLTFILVFARKPPLPHAILVSLMPIVVLPLLVLLIGRAYEPFWLVLPVHLIGFFVISMVCHGELAADRPDPVHLTEFYLLLSAGGVLGGLFNALVAPLVFSSVLEYPLVVVLSAFLLPWGDLQRKERRWKWDDLCIPLALVGLGIAGLKVLGEISPTISTGTLSDDRRFLGLVGVMAVLSYPSVGRPVRFGLCLAAVTAIGLGSTALLEDVLHEERSFFGVHRVKLSHRGETTRYQFHELVHGNISHGLQNIDPARRREPLAYYHRRGPLGQIFAMLKEQRSTSAPIAVVGLGSGAIACYLETGQSLTYYEIDPAVERIAHNPSLFTFLGDARGPVNVVLGDGRLTLASAENGQFGLVVVDAFSSDAIPLHLLTREALQSYLSKLRTDGVLVFHISNRYLALEPMLGDLAGDAKLTCLANLDVVTKDEEAEGKATSHYVVMARSPSYLGKLATDGRWHRVTARPGERVWTDDFSNILSVLGGGTARSCISDTNDCEQRTAAKQRQDR